MNNDIVTLTVPKRADYMSLIRLTASSIGYNCGFDVDEIEDLKVSIGEACTNSLSFSKEDTIELAYQIQSDKLIIRVVGAVENIVDDLKDERDRKLGILIIRSLMDEVNFNDTGIEMIKFFE